MARDVGVVARAALVAGALSGAPSTGHALATGRPVLAATRAAGTLLGRASVPRGAVAHAGLSAGWAGVLGILLPTRHTVAWGACAGLAIGALDLGIAARWFPAIRRLPLGPQLADHVVFGTLVGCVLARAERSGRD